MKKLKIGSGDLKFLCKNTGSYSDSESLLPILHKIELGKHSERDFYEFELTENEHEIILEFLINLIGTNEDGEIDATGRVADNLIDTFNIYSG